MINTVQTLTIAYILFCTVILIFILRSKVNVETQFAVAQEITQLSQNVLVFETKLRSGWKQPVEGVDAAVFEDA